MQAERLAPPVQGQPLVGQAGPEPVRAQQRHQQVALGEAEAGPLAEHLGGPVRHHLVAGVHGVRDLVADPLEAAARDLDRVVHALAEIAGQRQDLQPGPVDCRRRPQIRVRRPQRVARPDCSFTLAFSSRWSPADRPFGESCPNGTPTAASAHARVTLEKVDRRGAAVLNSRVS